MHVVLHCNGGAEIGVGHVLRSLALAEEALARGHRVTMAGVIEGPFLERALASMGLTAVPARDLARTVRELVPDVVHLDTYDEVSLSATQPHLLSNMEDDVFGRRPSDISIDSTLDAELVDRPPAVVSMMLRGTRFAPLRRLVTSRRRALAPMTGVPRVLVLMGGSDPRDLSPRAVTALAATSRAATVTVVAPRCLHEACQTVAGQLPLRLLSDVDDMAGLMVEQDLVLSAAGTSVWELCCLGLPMALVCAVENQRQGYDRVIARGAAEGLGIGDIDRHAVGTLARLLDDVTMRRSLADRAAALVDGRGAWRIVTAWEQLLAEPPEWPPSRPTSLDVRLAELADAERLLEWRNDSDTRRFSRSTETVDLVEHRQWLQRSLENDARLLLVAADATGDIGTIRWDRRDGRSWEVSITVAPHRRGAGMARPLLAAGEQALVSREGAPTDAVAAVRADNTASRRLFTRAGYLRESDPDDEGFALYVKTLTRPGG